MYIYLIYNKTSRGEKKQTLIYIYNTILSIYMHYTILKFVFAIMYIYIITSLILILLKKKSVVAKYSRSEEDLQSHPPPIKRLLSSNIFTFKYNISIL